MWRLGPLCLAACLAADPFPLGPAGPEASDPVAPESDTPTARDTEGSDPDTDLPDDTDPPVDTEPAVDTEPPVDTEPVIPPRRRMVLAGDSWSAGLVFPLQDSLAANGHTDIDLWWDGTANGGSRAEDWLANEYPPGTSGPPAVRMLDALDLALDASPPAEVLVLVISGNDLNAKAADGLGTWPGFLYDLAFDGIEADVRALIAHARQGRPQLEVVLVGYTYLHFEMMALLGMDFDGFNTATYNQALIDLETRKLEIAQDTDHVWYAHNLGLLQHTYGDTMHFPFSIPNPLVGLPEYGPGVLPAPGVAPTYFPFPGGWSAYPAPVDHLPDGVHPDAAGFRLVADHLLDQGLSALLDGQGWTPR
jgi:hypothetical protein